MERCWRLLGSTFTICKSVSDILSVEVCIHQDPKADTSGLDSEAVDLSDVSPIIRNKLIVVSPNSPFSHSHILVRLMYLWVYSSICDDDESDQRD